MKSFGIGLALGLIGLMLWWLGTGLVAWEEATQELTEVFEEMQEYGVRPPLQSTEGKTSWQGPAIKYGGFGLMMAGPIVYWIIPPVIRLVKRKRE